MPASLPPVYSIEPLTDPRWSRLVERHPCASVFHSLPWLDALWRTYQYQPVAYTTAPPGEELRNALLFLRVKSWLTGSRLVSLPFSDHCEPLVSGLEEFQQLLVVPRAELEAGRWKYIEVRPKTIEYAESIHGFAELYWLHQLDLRPELEDLYHSLHVDSIRRKIQRAEREGLTLEAGASQSQLSDFYGLHLRTRRRHSLPPHPRKWFENVLDSFKGKATIRIARRGGAAIASVFTIENARSLVYKYGCSEAQFHNTGAMPFVFWDMIRDAKLRGFAQIDLGRTEPENKGLTTFKERWGASRGKLLYARYPVRSEANSLAEKRLVGLAKNAFSHCPDALLAAVGRLLYPHIG